MVYPGINSKPNGILQYLLCSTPLGWRYPYCSYSAFKIMDADCRPGEVKRTFILPFAFAST